MHIHNPAYRLCGCLRVTCMACVARCAANAEWFGEKAENFLLVLNNRGACFMCVLARWVCERASACVMGWPFFCGLRCLSLGSGRLWHSPRTLACHHDMPECLCASRWRLHGRCSLWCTFSTALTRRAGPHGGAARPRTVRLGACGPANALAAPRQRGCSVFFLHSEGLSH